MHTYLRGDSHLFCGHWNGSPLEIGFPTTCLRQVPNSEMLHYHDYYEYYVMLEGRAELEVEGQPVPLQADSIVMIEPGERHRIRSIDSERGARWLIIKQHSAPNSKHIVPSQDTLYKDEAL